MEKNWWKLDTYLLDRSSTDEISLDDKISILQIIEKNIYHKKPKESQMPYSFSVVGLNEI